MSSLVIPTNSPTAHRSTAARTLTFWSLPSRWSPILSLTANIAREGDHWQDCSCGCRHFAVLDGPLGADWGVRMNKNSPRAGLLTFEHQGRLKFEAGTERMIRWLDGIT
jgi:hypothetical protein